MPELLLSPHQVGLSPQNTGTTIFAFPSTGQSRLLLAAGDRADGRYSIEAPFLRPIDLRDYHRPITAEMLAEIAGTYDPEGIYQAQFNLDHSWGGPSRGAIDALEIRNEWLWLIGWIQPEVAAQIRKGELVYLSAEIDFDHPATGGKAYLTGMAFLGSLEPAIYGQPKLSLAEAPAEPPPAQLSRQSGVGYLAAPHQLILLGAAERQKEPDMSKPSDTPAPNASGAAPASDPVVEPSAELLAARADVTSLRQELSGHRREIALARADVRVERDLSRLSAQVTPAVLAVPGFRDLLREFAAAPETHRITLAAKGAEAERPVPYYDVLVEAFGKLPRFDALGAGEMAGDPVEMNLDPRSDAQAAYDRSRGISDEQALAALRPVAAYPQRMKPN